MQTCKQFLLLHILHLNKSNSPAKLVNLMTMLNFQEPCNELFTCRYSVHVLMVYKKNLKSKDAFLMYMFSNVQLFYLVF